MVLWVSLFLYMRQRITLLEDKVALLSKLTTTVAGITKTLSEPDKESESEDEPKESEDEYKESESEDEPEQEIPVHLTMNEFPRFKEMDMFKCVVLDNSTLLNVVTQELNTMDAVEIEEIEPVHEVVENVEIDVDLPKRVVSVDDLSEVKTLTVDVSYDALSVKELKDKVAELNGPKLKTKKELLEFLKNKM